MIFDRMEKEAVIKKTPSGLVKMIIEHKKNTKDIHFYKETQKKSTSTIRSKKTSYPDIFIEQGFIILPEFLAFGQVSHS